LGPFALELNPFLAARKPPQQRSGSWRHHRRANHELQRKLAKSGIFAANFGR